MITIIFHDFPGLEKTFLKFHDLPGCVGTLHVYPEVRGRQALELSDLLLDCEAGQCLVVKSADLSGWDGLSACRWIPMPVLNGPDNQESNQADCNEHVTTKPNCYPCYMNVHANTVKH